MQQPLPSLRDRLAPAEEIFFTWLARACRRSSNRLGLDRRWSDPMPFLRHVHRRQRRRSGGLGEGDPGVAARPTESSALSQADISTNSCSSHRYWRRGPTGLHGRRGLCLPCPVAICVGWVAEPRSFAHSGNRRDCLTNATGHQVRLVAFWSFFALTESL